MTTKLIDQHSCPSSKSDLELWAVPPTQVAVQDGYWHAARLASNCTSTGPWRFHVEAGPQYLDVSKNFLYMKLKIVNPDGTNYAAPAAGNPVVFAPINMIGKTFFKQLKLSINNKLVSDSSDTYAYRAYLETILNYGAECKNTQLRSAQYTKDTVNNAGTVDHAANAGFVTRAGSFALSNSVECMAKLHCDLFQSDKLLLSNTELMLELFKNSDAFNVLCYGAQPPAFRIEIEDMIWYIRKVEVAPSVHLAIEQMLGKAPAKYPIRRVKIARMHIAPQRLSAPTNALIVGQLPRRICLAVVGQEAFFGNIAMSPFRFNNHGIKQVSLNVAGKAIPREPIEMDYANNRYVRAYLQLHDGLGIGDEDKGVDITLEDFKNYQNLYVFDLTPDNQDCAHWQLVTEGSVSVDIKFTAAVPDPGLELLAYCEYDNLLMIDRLRNVHSDYSV